MLTTCVRGVYATATNARNVRKARTIPSRGSMITAIRSQVECQEITLASPLPWTQAIAPVPHIRPGLAEVSHHGLAAMARTPWH